MENAFYAQSGGVTSVINSSAYGLMSELKRSSPNTKIYASQNGIVGLIDDKMYDIGKTKRPLSLLIQSPAGMFGSCRFKLPDLDQTDFYENVFKRLDEKSIRYFHFKSRGRGKTIGHVIFN